MFPEAPPRLVQARGSAVPLTSKQRLEHARSPVLRRVRHVQVDPVRAEQHEARGPAQLLVRGRILLRCSHHAEYGHVWAVERAAFEEQRCEGAEADELPAWDLGAVHFGIGLAA